MVTVATVDEQVDTEQRQRQLLVDIWVVLRAVAVEAPMDADYTKWADELSQRLDKEFNLT